MEKMLVALALLLVALPGARALPAADFVVIGAGTAGCTIAATLCTRLPHAKITLVERGQPRTRTDRLQSSAAANIFRSWANPNLTAVLPTRPIAGLDGRVGTLFTGANYGGGSAVNGGQLLLPPTGTFDAWGIANLTDARAEKLFWNSLRTAQPDTGVPPPGLRPRYSAQWLRAAGEGGLPFASTPFRPPRSSFASFDARLTFDTAGRRVDACRTFVRPARGGACAGRLRVLRGMRAERVLFKNGRVARSVVLTRLKDGEKMRLHARREVLVAAGAIESAALLLRSGVGPRGEIEGRVRRFVADLPVGRRLQTRLTVFAGSRYGAPLADVNNPAKLSSPEALRAFRAGRGGVLGKSPMGPMARFGKLGYAFSVIGRFPVPNGQRVLESACVVDVSDDSFGSVRLAAGDAPVDAGTPPVVATNPFDNAKDMRRATRCLARMRLVHRLLNRQINGTEIFRDGDSDETLATQQGLIGKVKAEAGIAPHYTGTCSVGHVVDARLRVLGLERLRVVDSAAIPRLPKTAGPMASVYVVALHAGDMIASAHTDLGRRRPFHQMRHE